MANQVQLLKYLEVNNLNCIRMQGTVQSYHILDSQMYYNAKQMRKIIQKQQFMDIKRAKK